MTVLINSETPASDKDYWRTPPNLVDDALNLLGCYRFDIDVCAKSINEKIKVALHGFITEEQDALHEDTEWFSYSDYMVSFCNPPFSRKWEFVKKGIEQVKKHGRSVLFVLPYSPCTKAWDKYINGENCIVYVPDGRYNFLKPDGTQGKNSSSFAVALVLFVPFYTNGAQYVNYKIGIKD